MRRYRFAVAVVSVVLVAWSMACAREGSVPTAPSAATGPGGGAAADGSTLKATAPTPVSPIADAQVEGTVTLTATDATLKYGQGAVVQYRFEVIAADGSKAQISGLLDRPLFPVTAALEFGKRYAWHVRAEYQGAAGPWSATASFLAPAGGYNRPGELYDPLTNGKTVGEVVGPATFIPGKGVRLDSTSSYVRYLLPATVTSGEFSMEIEGLRANAPGDKSKVFGMQEGQDDFVTNRYRVDIQYRGTSGFPPNAITFRALYGSATDLGVRYEPDTTTRMNSVRLLDPSTAYLWKATWGSEFRVVVLQGGANGQTIYNVGVKSPRGTYAPSPQYAYLGAPVGRSGAESATIPGTIYRNVWIGNRPRPQ